MTQIQKNSEIYQDPTILEIVRTLRDYEWAKKIEQDVTSQPQITVGYELGS